MRYLLIATIAMYLFAACSKKEIMNAQKQTLYGKWAMGPGDSDTLEFSSENGRNILRYLDAHFITGIYMEREYRYVNGVLSIQMYPSEDFTQIPSFTLLPQDDEFSIMANELYPQLSSTITLIYRKIQ